MTRVFLVLLAASSCNTADGTRGSCGEGGALTACPDTVTTAEDACWRLVDCAAIPLHSDDDNVFDWDNCVNRIEQMTADRERVVIDCIGASTCDQLKVANSPTDPHSDDFECVLLGDNN